MSTSAEGLLLLPGEGEKSNHMLVKIRARDLGGAFSVMEAVIKPYQLLAPHTHTHEDQAVFVISGELEFEVDGEGGTRFTAPAGSYVIKPRGIQHCFWNQTDTPARYIELSGGENFEHFTDDADEDVVKASREAEERYALTFHTERIPKLMADHKLTSVSGLNMPWEGAPPVRRPGS